MDGCRCARGYILTLLNPQQVIPYVPLYPYISLHFSLCLFFLPSIHSPLSPPSMRPWLRPSSFKTPAGYVLRTSVSLHLPPSLPLFVLPSLHLSIRPSHHRRCARGYILPLLKPQYVMSYVPLYPYISLHRPFVCSSFLPSIRPSFHRLCARRYILPLYLPPSLLISVHSTFPPPPLGPSPFRLSFHPLVRWSVGPSRHAMPIPSFKVEVQTFENYLYIC